MEAPELFFTELSPIENNLLEKHYVIDEGQAILVISLDIGDGRKDEIRVYENDNSDQLAIDFCYKHKLGAKAKLLLAGEIEKHFKVALSRSIALSISHQSTSPAHPKSPPARNGRSQTFTQRSMQVKQSLLKTPPNPSSEASSPSYNPITRRLSPSKLSQASTSIQASPSHLKKPNKRNQSLYEINSSAKPQNSSFNSKSVSVSVPCSSNPHQSASKPEGKTLGKSERIMKRIKYSRYKEIFDSLCPNSKAVISPETIQRSRVPGAVRKIIAPLVEELEELDETLNFHEFYDAMEILMKVLTPGDKSLLLLPNKKNAQAKPEPMRRTKTAVCSNRNMSTSSLYERSVHKKQETSRKLAKERESLEEEQMKECKFVPIITSVHRRSLSSKASNLEFKVN